MNAAEEDDIPFSDAVSSYAEEIKGNKILSKEEEKDALAKAVKGDRKAQTALIESMAPSALDMALFHYDGKQTVGDLLQQANRALYYCAAHLDGIPKGASFSDYASSLINARLDQYQQDEEKALEEAESSASAAPSAPTSKDGISFFFSEIGKYPLLSAQQENLLGRIIQKGEREGASEQEKKDAKEAVGKMVDSNLRLVASIAKNYRGNGVPFLDLVQEGSMGLQRAAEKFDPSMGTRFSTYASYWITQSIARALADQGRAIRIPNHMVARIGKVRKAENALAMSLGREPTLEELCSALPEFDREDIASILKIPDSVASLDAPVGQDPDGADLLSFQTGDDDPSSLVEQEERKQEIQKALSCLSDRERLLISYLYGLDGKEEIDMAELGRRFHLSRERIRQIRVSALSKMKKALSGEEEA